MTAALLAGCGGGGGGEKPKPPATPAALLDAAFSHPIPTSLTKVKLGLDLDGLPPLLGKGDLDLSGPYVSGKGKRIPSVDWKVRAEVGPLSRSAEVVSTGDDAFVKVDGDNYEVGADRVAAQNAKVQAAPAAAGGHPSPLANLGLHPRRWFAAGRALPDETVDGVTCAHIVSPLNAPAVIEDGHAVANGIGLTGSTPAPTHFTPVQARSVMRDIRSGQIEAWIGRDDQIVRRFKITADFVVPKDQRAGLHGVSGGKVDLDIEQLEVGAAKTITGPAPGSGRPIGEIKEKIPKLPSLPKLPGL
jgi:hypothetical protein